MRKKKLKYPFLFAILFLLFLLALIFPKNKSIAASEEYCAFCNPDVLNRQKFYEDDLVLALYTHKPIFPGHCLIIPKRHIKTFDELSDDEAQQMASVIKKVHQAVQSTFHTSSYLLLQKNGREAGQMVPHVHFHYISRKTGATSTLSFFFHMYLANWKKPIKEQEMATIVAILKAAMPPL